MKVYHFDPDFRRRAPDGDVPYCCRCQKPLLNSADKLTGVAVTVNWEEWTMVEGHNNNEIIRGRSTSNGAFGNCMVGPDCWRQIKKLKINQEAA
jgi:hypothetical protein